MFHKMRKSKKSSALGHTPIPSGQNMALDPQLRPGSFTSPNSVPRLSRSAPNSGDMRLHSVLENLPTPGISESESLSSPPCSKAGETSTKAQALLSGQDSAAVQDFKDRVLLINKLIGCPICYNTLDRTLVQCTNGHGICKTCATKIDNCPCCKQKLAIQKSTLLGQILEHLPKPCPYIGQGCEHILFDNEEHSSSCMYRPASCIKDLCQWRGLAKDLLDHVRVCFEDDDSCVPFCPNATETLAAVLGSNESCYIPLKFDNELFLIYACNCGPGTLIYHKLYHIPKSTPVKKYYLVVTLKKGNLEGKWYCHASTKVENDLTTEGAKCVFNFSDTELEWFLDSEPPHGYYSYSIETVNEETA